jgi:hypothetical protein
MRAPSGWLTLEKWGAVVTEDNGAGVRLPWSVPRPTPPTRLARPVKEAWLAWDGSASWAWVNSHPGA